MIQDKLVIFLPSHDMSRPSWAVIDAASIIKEQTLHGEPADLIHAAIDKEIIVIIPAEDILLTTARLPKMSRSRLVQALPFALEEQLVGDIDNLHFACGGIQSDGSTPVAVVAKEKMQQWLTLVQSWNIQADIFLPTMLALPFADETWHVMVSGMVYARTGSCQGFACDENNLAKFLSITMASATLRPQLVYIHNYSDHAVAATLDADLNTNESILPHERMISDLALNMAHPPAFNLLQGDYAAKKSRFPQMKKLTQAVSYLAIAWIFLLFLYPTISYFILNHRVSSIDGQIEQIYKRNFPQSSSLVAPKLRMEEKLQKLNAQIGENRFLLLLGYVGKAMLEASSGVTLKRMDFQNNQLTLELTAQSSDDFSAFTDYLTQQGLSVKQQNANLVGARVNATVVVD